MRTQPDGVSAPAATRQAGSAAVEFALVLPLVLVVVLGLVQVGSVVRDRLLVEAAARAGARAAAIQADPSAVTDAARAAAPGLVGELIRVDVLRGGSRGDPVTVSVTYPDPVRVPLVDWLTGGSVTLRAAAVSRQEFA